jgi:hypothetical protein
VPRADDPPSEICCHHDYPATRRYRLAAASSFEAGLLSAATYGAFIFVALRVGVVVDRFPLRRIMICCDSARLAILGSMPVAAALNRLILGQLHAVVLAAGVRAAFFDVSQQSYVPSVLHPDGFTEGFGKLGASASFAEVSGRGLASSLLAVVGAATAVTADAFSYAVSVLSLLSIRRHESQRERRSTGAKQLRWDVVKGLAFIVRHRVLRKTIASAAVGNLFIAMQVSLNLLFLVRILHVRPVWAGLFTTVGSLGGIIGGMQVAPIDRRIASLCIIWFSLLVFDALSLLPLAAPSWRVALFVLGYCVSFFACAVFAASQLAYQQAACPPDLRGRMNAGRPLAGSRYAADRESPRRDARCDHWDSFLDMDRVRQGVGCWFLGLLFTFRQVRNLSELAPSTGPSVSLAGEKGRQIVMTRSPTSFLIKALSNEISERAARQPCSWSPCVRLI